MHPETQNALFNPDAERNVFSCFLQFPETQKLIRTLHTSHFTGPRATILEAMQTLQAGGEPIDLVTMDAQLRRLHKERLDVQQELLSYANYAVTPANIGAYVDILREAAARRVFEQLMREASLQVLNPAQPVEELSDAVRGKLRTLSGENAQQEIGLNQTLLDAVEELERRMRGEITGMSTGIAELDHITGGLFDGELSVIGARPSVGKSALGLFIAQNVARSGKRALFVSREMTRKQLGLRLISREGKVRGHALHTGRLTEKEHSSVIESLGSLSALPITIDIRSRTPAQIRSAVARMQDHEGLDLLVVDYLQLLDSGRRMDNRVQEVGVLSRALKEIAVDHDIPVIAIAQLNRASDGHRPSMKDLRESGSIEQDADNVYLLHKPEEEDVHHDSKNYYAACRRMGAVYLELIIDKARQGKTWTVDLLFDAQYMRFAGFGDEEKGAQQHG